MTIPFSVESKVRCRNQVWEVLKVTDNTDDSWTVRLYPENGGKPQSFLFPHTPIEPIGSALDNLQEGRIDHIDHYRLLTSATRLALVYEYDKLLSISNSKMIPEPYQLLAVKKVMESLRQRFLIADDVGLGKTIEAGLIMQELAARQRGDRVLIVVPAALQDQWKTEMQRHFLRPLYIYNSRKLEGIQELVDENLNPWLAKNSIVTSIDWVKPQYQGMGAARRNSNRVFDQLMKVEKRWELVIIDEAHYVSTDSNRADFAKAVQERGDSLLLLTATPHSGNPEHFFNLLNLIDPFMFADPGALDRADARERVDKVMIRRGKETIYEVNDAGDLVKKFRDRAPQSIEITYTEAEQDLYDAVSAYTGSGWAQLSRKRKISAADRNVGKFLLTLVQKRMVSSPAALRETLRHRIDSIVETRTLTRLDGRASGEIARLLKDYERGELMEEEDQELVERYIETRRVQAMYAERTNEIRTLRELLAKAEELLKTGQDSKLAWLRHFLQQLFAREPGEKVIIFTEYRDTLNYLKAKLEKEWFLGSDSIVMIHGGMPLGDSEEEIGSKLYAEWRFNEPDTRLLLATDAASEGLNLQRYCHILINYELPWNPNRLEQRIGRIHRYGQRHVARIYNLMIEGSKEAEIFRRLQDKIEIIRQQLGSMAEVLGVLERISLDDVILRVLDRSVDIADVGAIAEAELKRLEEIAESIRKTQFLSGCRQFTREDIHAAEGAIEASQQAIPQHKDVQAFVETFLRVFGDQGHGDRDGRKLQPAKHKGVYRLLVPSVIQDDKLPKTYSRVTFERAVATKDWSRSEEPEFRAFGHPLLERLFPEEELEAFPEEEARELLKSIAKQYESLRSTLVTADAEETRQQGDVPVLFQVLAVDLHEGVRLVTDDGIFEPSYVLKQAELSGKPRQEYQGKDTGRDLACLIWMLPWRSSLDVIVTDGTSAPLSMMEVAHRALTHSDVPWAMLTNGQQLRLLAKGTAHKPRRFLEIDLAAVVDRRGDSEALLAFRYCQGLFSGASFTDRDGNDHTRLDRVLIGSERHGKEIGDELKQNVLRALEELGDGFLHYLRTHPVVLEEWRKQKGSTLSADAFLASEPLLEDIYHESLSLMYRLLFLFYAESRNLLPMEDEMYRESYSLESIRDDIISVHDDPDPRRFFGQGDTQLWDRLTELFRFLNTGWRGVTPAYKGGLFDSELHEFVEQCKVPDYFLARAIDLFSRTQPRSGQSRGEGRKKVTYRDLDIRHLGSIYEGLLEYSAHIADQDMVVMQRGSGAKASEEYVSVSELKGSEKQQLTAWRQAVAENPDNPQLPRGCKVTGEREKGSYFLVYGGRESKRKPSGSYYTPDYIVQYIVENTLSPLVRGECRPKPEPLSDELKRIGAKEKPAPTGPLSPDEILDLKVLDPAMGSGHFLVAVTEYLARAYGEALLREGQIADGVISDDEFIRHKRMIVERCIYGVDINPMAVELAKLSLWLFTMDRSRPLSFLDHHLKCGNSLIGAWLKNLGEFPKFEQRGKTKKQDGSEEQGNLFEQQFKARVPLMVRDLFGIMSKETLTLGDIEAKKTLDKAIEEVKRPFKNVADAWVVLLFGDEVRDYEVMLSNVDQAREQESVKARSKRAFHWQLEFPEVFFDSHGSYLGNAGFHAVLGNPPYGLLPKEERDIFLVLFDHQNYQLDRYLLFFEQALRLCTSQGLVGFIIPNTWLVSILLVSMRKFLLTEHTITQMVNFEYPVFEDATVDNVITIVKSEIPQETCVSVESWNEPTISAFSHNFPQVLWIENSEEPINILLTSNQIAWQRNLNEKCIALGSIAKIVQGTKPFQKGKGKPAQTEEILRTKPFVSTVKKDKTFRPLLRGSLIQKYRILWNGDYWISYGDWLAEPRYTANFDAPEKLVIRQTGDSLVAAYDSQQFIARDNLYTLVPTDKRYPIKGLLGVINSKLMERVYRMINPEEGEVLAQAKRSHLVSLPMPKATEKNLHILKEIATLVDEIINTDRGENKKTQRAAENIETLIEQLYLFQDPS